MNCNMFVIPGYGREPAGPEIGSALGPAGFRVRRSAASRNGCQEHAEALR
jgi:hypothetical protein